MSGNIQVNPGESLSEVAQRELLVNARIEAVRASLQLSSHRSMKAILEDARTVEEWILRDPTDRG